MPYTKDGIVPDLIINSLAIPSRMTIAQLIECILGKTCSLNGYNADATPFSGVDAEQIADVLEQTGYERYGTETLYNGRTGEQLKAKIFIGPTFYYRLKHLVSDKIHCLTMDHEVLTDKGWKFFPQITKEDKIATLKDGQLVYDHPIDLLYYPDYEGKMYRIKTQQIDLNVTMNHRMYVSEIDKDDYKLVKAEEIVGKEVKYKNGAIYVAEIRNNMNNNDKALHEQKMNDQITKTFYKRPYDCDYYNCSSWKIIDFKYMKSLPEWVFTDLFRGHCQCIIDEMLYDFEKNTIEVAHKSMADDIMRLCLHAGYSCKLSESNFDEKVYIIHVSHNNSSLVNKDTIIKEEVYNYQGEVFCLQVPSEVFYVRRNGKCVWTGNSRSSGPYQLLTKQPAEGRSRSGK